MPIDNKLAVLDLIASDDSYKNFWQLNEPLRTFPDSGDAQNPSPLNEPDVITIRVGPLQAAVS